MKILIVSRGVRPLSSNLTGGAESVLLNHARGLAQLGNEVHVVSDYEGDPSEEQAVVIHPIGVNRRLGESFRKSGFYLWILLHLAGNFLAFWSALRALRKADPRFDVVHCHGGLSGLLLALFHKATPIVYTEHDSTPWACVYPSFAERAIRRTIYRLFNVSLFKRNVRILVLYSEQMNEIHERWAIPLENMAVLPNGVNELSFNPTSDSSAHIQSSAAPPAEDFCLFVGRLEPRKGADILLRALQDCSASCVIVGDGPERANLQALASELGLDSRVTFAGSVQNGAMKHFYRRASFVVTPSLSEAFPLVALEAMACEKPVVASRVGALPSLIETSQCGLLSNPGDAIELARNVQTLTDSPELAQTLGRNGREAILQSFTWERIASRLETMYRSLQANQAEAGAVLLGRATTSGGLSQPDESKAQ